MLFKNTTYSGKLGEFLNKIENHRTEAIYNKEYRYIKQIIYDDELQEKYGSTREGYERYKRDLSGYASYSGEIDLRVQTDRDGVILGYFTEAKKKVNDPLSEIEKIYEDAKQEFFNILGCTDTEALEYWLSDKIHINPMEANSYLYGVKKLEIILKDYEEDEEFKVFLDKLI